MHGRKEPFRSAKLQFSNKKRIFDYDRFEQMKQLRESPDRHQIRWTSHVEKAMMLEDVDAVGV